jgi:hypothetical protein
MKLIDLYYQAFRAFRTHTLEDDISKKLRYAIAQSSQKHDILTSVKYDCVIELDWIQNIEEGLVYVEKAIHEDRQFIRTEGEVVPIEKVKRVSKSSVEHLSKHSNLITRVPKEDLKNIIPEKLYVVEKLSDYLVYENRFLYMLLLYLKDFIQMRLDNIRDKTTMFEAHMLLNKEVETNQRNIQYQLSFHDKYDNDPRLMEQYMQIPLLKRAETIYAVVVSLLATPLMKEVAKAPVIKPPVVKTNVLRMNQNFRAALTLYDYVTSYNQLGYTIIENKKTYQPFPAAMGDEIAETIELTAMIAYITSNDILEELEKRYDDRERLLQEAQRIKNAEDLKRIKKRFVEMNLDPFEYITKLERRILELEKESTELSSERNRNIQLQSRVDALEAELVTLNQTLDDQRTELLSQNDEIERLQQKYFDDMTAAIELHRQELSELSEQHRNALTAMMERHQLELQSLRQSHERLIQSIEESHHIQIQELQEAIRQEREEMKQRHQSEMEAMSQQHTFALEELTHTHQDTVLSLTNQHQAELDKLESNHAREQARFEDLCHQKTTLLETRLQEVETISLTNQRNLETMTLEHQETVERLNQELTSFQIQCKVLDEEKKFANAQYHALKQQYGLMTSADDRTSRDQFLELESEMKAYRTMFKMQWKKAKKAIKESAKRELLGNGDKKKGTTDV